MSEEYTVYKLVLSARDSSPVLYSHMETLASKYGSNGSSVRWEILQNDFKSKDKVTLKVSSSSRWNLQDVLVNLCEIVSKSDLDEVLTPSKSI